MTEMAAARYTEFISSLFFLNVNHSYGQFLTFEESDCLSLDCGKKHKP